jgi:hypothetical protein
MDTVLVKKKDIEILGVPGPRQSKTAFLGGAQSRNRVRRNSPGFLVELKHFIDRCRVRVRGPFQY